MRVEKIKSRGSLTRAAQHNTRERPPDTLPYPERTPLNTGMSGQSSPILARFEQRLPAKVRKNAVLAAEFMIAVPSDHYEMMLKEAGAEKTAKWTKTYLEWSRDWAIDVLGGKGNLLDWHIHMDEKAPHVHVLMMPLRDGKLSYNSYLGGSKHALEDLQTDFAEQVGKKFHMERGRPREETGHRHIPPREFYRIGEAAVREVRARQQRLKEKPNDKDRTR